jgi:hypothetical protein
LVIENNSDETTKNYVLNMIHYTCTYNTLQWSLTRHLNIAA